ncbi:hypothetical protein CBR_g6454 [Chara braunii]|uniref:Uncharacterized protein n=1 Tax=Chara braunii TaxID=69332 RepID=A0A388KJX5_CHABU|nr:hypothetical protein CBR_g6454 [Chara braunii]|eukprot:GBG70326.1 hypothetical protein CBR_g6454 [Chara braunii]
MVLARVEIGIMTGAVKTSTPQEAMSAEETGTSRFTVSASESKSLRLHTPTTPIGRGWTVSSSTQAHEHDEDQIGEIREFLPSLTSHVAEVS